MSEEKGKKKKKSWWDSANTKLAVVGAIIGLISIFGNQAIEYLNKRDTDAVESYKITEWRKNVSSDISKLDSLVLRWGTDLMVIKEALKEHNLSETERRLTDLELKQESYIQLMEQSNELLKTFILSNN